MSATIAALLKRLAVLVLTDKKARKVVLGIILGVFVILLLPVMAVAVIFSGEFEVDVGELQDMIVSNLSTEERENLQFIEDTMQAIEDAMLGAGFSTQQVQEAQVIYTLTLSEHAKESDFVSKLVGCFAQEQTEEQLVATVNSTFGTNIDVREFIHVMDSIRSVYIDTSGFVDTATKNNLDLVQWAIQAEKAGWGYVWGTYGLILDRELFEKKKEQYPKDVGDYAEFIEKNWLGKRTADCVGLIKGYGWFNPATNQIEVGTNGMPDIRADTMYQNATEKGTIDTIPETLGLAVWQKGHIGIYIGNGEVIHASTTTRGVVKTALDSGGWTHWLKIPYIVYQ